MILEETSRLSKNAERQFGGILPLLPVVTTGGCGSGSCGSGCGSQCDRSLSVSDQSQKVQRKPIAFSERRVNLEAIPSTGTFVTTIDLDITVECNLRCTYCFKEKWNEHMEAQVAFDTMIWLLHASGPVKNVNVNFMGGEPLIQFKLIQRLVPFAKRRAVQHGKNIHFGMTTNGTLVTDEVVKFWKKWGLGFHTSIDGTPDVQDVNRPTTSGRGSSGLVSKAVPKILAYRPGTCARSTVVPSSAHRIVESYRYFRSLGYTNIAFVPGGPQEWDDKSNKVYEQAYHEVGELLINDMRNGVFINLKGVDDFIQGFIRQRRFSHSCGAGRGLLLIDLHGDIWPCHRWNKAEEQSWRIGSIYENFNEEARKQLDCDSFTDRLEQNCEICPANLFCSGGCPAENLETTGSVYRRHWNSCEQTRTWARVGKYVHDVLYTERNPVFMKHYYPNVKVG